MSGSTNEAITHALAADDVDGATDLIARHYGGYINSGQVATVRRWLGLLGDDRIAAHPLAAHCAAWTAALSGDQRVVQLYLPLIEAAGDAGPLPDGMRSFASSAAILQAIFGFDGLGPMREAGLRAVALETDPESRWYSAARTGLCGALYWADEFGPATAHAQEARLNPAAPAMLRLAATTVMTMLSVEAGQLAQAKELALEARELATDSQPAGADAQLARLERLQRRLVGRSRPAVSGEPLTVTGPRPQEDAHHDHAERRSPPLPDRLPRRMPGGARGCPRRRRDRITPRLYPCCCHRA